MYSQKELEEFNRKVVKVTSNHTGHYYTGTFHTQGFTCNAIRVDDIIQSSNRDHDPGSGLDIAIEYIGSIEVVEKNPEELYSSFLPKEVFNE